jgi:poly(A) polymerase
MSTREDAEARLRAAPWLNDLRTQRVFALLPRTRAVGGVVRDTILGRERDNAEIDFATELLPDDVMRRATDAGVPAHPTGIEHGTVTLALDGLVAEVTTLREDIETDGRRAVVKFGTDWAEDAARRDFTLNALYADAVGRLLDPLDGLEDTLAGRVRFIGDADQRIAEDRLRVYRFFRFSAGHGGQALDPDGLAAVARAAGELANLSAERVGAEMKRILRLPRAATTLRAMAAAGVLRLDDGMIDELAAYEDRANPTLAGRLAVLMDAVDVRAAWRFSNDDAKAAEAVRSAAALLRSGKANEAAYRYPAAVRDAAALVPNAVAIPATIPPFPLTGRDLVQRGYQQGAPLGSELQRLEQTWIDSGFTLDREALVAAMRAP